MTSGRKWAALAGAALGAALVTSVAGWQDGWFTGGGGEEAVRPHSAGEPSSDHSSSAALDEPESWATEDFPVNADGLTYGSAAEAHTSDEAPDLIAVVGDDGTLGFVRNDDLFVGEAVSSPEEALQYERDLAAEGPPTIPVYDLDGNEISGFTLEMGTTEARGDQP